MEYSIIGRGFIGTSLASQCNQPVVVYDRSTIDQVCDKKHNIIFLCAPTGNRLTVSRNPDSDLNDCKNLVAAIESCDYVQGVYFSTVDVFKDTPYGHNRRWLEKNISKDPRWTVVRLPSLVDPSISKGLLFDLAKLFYLENISLESTIQWYPVADLFKDVVLILKQGLKEINLVSRPIVNRELITRLRPELISQLEKNKVLPMFYDLRSVNNEYWVDERRVWTEIEKSFLKLKIL